MIYSFRVKYNKLNGIMGESEHHVKRKVRKIKVDLFWGGKPEDRPNVRSLHGRRTNGFFRIKSVKNWGWGSILENGVFMNEGLQKKRMRMAASERMGLG